MRSAVERPVEPITSASLRPEPVPQPERLAARPAPQRTDPGGQPDPPRHPEGLDEPAPQTKAPKRSWVGPLEAGLRYPFLVVLPVVLLLVSGLAIGLARHPSYTAQANINVGSVNVPAYTLEGVVSGNATLAASYARAGGAPGVLLPAARVAGITTAQARSRLNMSPVLGTTLIRVEATGPTKLAAITLSNAAARALISYVQKLNDQQLLTGLLPRYRSALSDESRSRARLARLDANKPLDQVAIERTKLDLATAQLQAQTFSGEYLNQDATPSGNDLQLTTPAVVATSDLSSVLQRLLLAGLALGLVGGLVLALVRANVPLMRRA